MKLSELKIGDTIEHYCCGRKVVGKIVGKTQNGVITKHKPIRWGKEVYTNTNVHQSTDLQFIISQTTPGAWYNGERITIK